MTTEERNEILSSYKWIKVKSYKMDETLSWQDRYHAFEKHHIEETNFLIDKIRTIVAALPDSNSPSTQDQSV